MMLDDVSPALLEKLRELGDEYGPLGVALAAAKLTDVGVLVHRLMTADEPETEAVEARTLAGDVQRAINYHSAENGSNTPDFILAEYLMDCLGAFDKAARSKARWSGTWTVAEDDGRCHRRLSPGSHDCALERGHEGPHRCGASNCSERWMP
jgi:hypothetical protein